MPYTLEWYIPDRILQAVVWGNLTTEEIEQANRALLDLLNGVSIPLYMLVNSTYLNQVDPLLTNFPHNFSFTAHPMIGQIIITEATSYTRSVIAEILHRMVIPLRFEATITTALDYLTNLDPTLPIPPPPTQVTHMHY